jgi:hypothetical protein
LAFLDLPALQGAAKIIMKPTSNTAIQPNQYLGIGAAVTCSGFVTRPFLAFGPEAPHA